MEYPELCTYEHIQGVEKWGSTVHRVLIFHKTLEMATSNLYKKKVVPGLTYMALLLQQNSVTKIRKPGLRIIFRSFESCTYVCQSFQGCRQTKYVYIN